MTLFAANISMLFTEIPVLDRFSAAREAGFDAVEMLFPYAFSSDELRMQIASTLPLILINTPAPDWDEGGRGCAAVPGAETRFREEFQQALNYARALDVGLIHIMSGAATGPEAHQTMVENLRWATAQAPHQRMTIEPINPYDMPGYFLNDFDLAANILDAVAAPNLALQFDAYHAQRITGDCIQAWQKHRRRAAHVQIAGFPGRHEPFGGQIDYPTFFAGLRNHAYTGHISAEYHPKTRTQDGLAWLEPARAVF